MNPSCGCITQWPVWVLGSGLSVTSGLKIFGRLIKIRPMHVQLKWEPWIHKLIYRALSQGPSSLQLSQDFLFPYVSPFWSSSQQLGSYLCLSFSVINFCNWAHLLAQEMEDRERKKLTQIHPTLLELQLQQMHMFPSLRVLALEVLPFLPQDFLGFGAWEEQQKKQIADKKLCTPSEN